MKAMPVEPNLRAGLAALAGAAALLWAALALPSPLAGIALDPIDRWALSVLALALAALGYAMRCGATRFGVLAFVFLTGSGAQLYMTEALWFPTLHLKPQNGREWLMVAVIALEAAVALRALRRARPGWVLAEARRRLGTARIAVYFAASFMLGVPLLIYVWRGAYGAYLAHVAVTGALMVLHLAVLIAMSQVRSPIRGVHRVSPIVPATFAVLASLLLAQFAFEHIPHDEDEVAYIFQARTLAGGALTAPAPPEAAQAGLEAHLFEISDGRWYAAAMPGWPAALALGLVSGLPWLVNPILAGISVLLAYDIARRKVGQEQADLVAAMMASSPWLLAAAGTLMPHTLTLALMLFAWWMVLRGGSDRTGLRRLAVAGLAIGWIVATRPLDGMVIGAATGLWILAGPGGSARRVMAFGAGLLVVVGLLLAYNAALTGSALTTPFGAYIDRHWAPGADAYGFGADIGAPGGREVIDLWPGHSPTEAAVNVLTMAASLQFDMLGWSIGSLSLVIAFLLWQRPLRQFDAAMIAVVIAVVAALALYWFADSYYLGPRYWFLASFPLLYLSARGYEALRTRFPGRNEEGLVRIDSILGLCCIFGLAVFTPWRGVEKYHRYGGYDPQLRDLAATGLFDGQVVIVAGGHQAGSALFLNDPWLDGSAPVFLQDTGDLDTEALAAAFPGRKVVRFVAE
ncbi:glycosyltransferase family 39 protein [Defluviimonas sp. WL0024]|uniref:Glycosyltransferase family 39 protein n=1 Tax=Albidovulum salinarum TaxID=2984153 RepID=A0ABT2X8Z9_9RHOB|nr:glycosyltransferase family 39 protein [Defluviimonas sp. WL0024]MCU9850424.1 glycosyltransferase family 39 protein [Defluviimonas sp. WL0024]